jgi:threonine aldolase
MMIILRMVDLRSDTVTLPTDEMLESIKNAELGDDVYGEDSTVNRLEELAAKTMGKEAALLVVSGTQANLTSVMAQTNRGDQTILESDAHIYHYEVGGISALAGVIPKLIRGHLGALDPEDVKREIQPEEIHHPKTALVCIENTHNRAGGTVITPEQIEALSEVTRSKDVPLYMDGARIFNASVALKRDVKDFTRHVDSLMFCLSKGLSAPVGSVIVGNSEFIKKARKIRKMLGGGMRQAGIIAAPGIVAIEKMVNRLSEDHTNARALAEGLSKLEKVSIDLDTVQTNIVKFQVRGLKISPEEFFSMLQKRGVQILGYEEDVMRMVTHRHITRKDVDYTLEVFEDVIRRI